MVKGYFRKICFVLLVSVLLASCGKRVLIDETHAFDNNVWMRFDPEVFEFDVRSTDVPCMIALSLRYDTSMMSGETLPLVVEFFADSNARHTFFPEIRLVEADGHRRGTLVDRFCTVTDTIDRCRLYNETGRMTYRLKQRTSKYELGGIAGLGMRVEEL